MRFLLLWTVLLLFTWSWAWGQTLTSRPRRPALTNGSTLPSQPPPLIPLTVPAGTPLKVALDQEVRVQKVGQPIHGKLVEPVYAFDKLVVPAGTEVIGKSQPLIKCERHGAPWPP